MNCSLAGQVAVITGANSGVGRSAAELLVQAGTHVTTICRNRERGERALAELREAAEPAARSPGGRARAHRQRQFAGAPPRRSAAGGTRGHRPGKGGAGRPAGLRGLEAGQHSLHLRVGAAVGRPGDHRQCGSPRRARDRYLEKGSAGREAADPAAHMADGGAGRGGARGVMEALLTMGRIDISALREAGSEG